MSLQNARKYRVIYTVFYFRLARLRPFVNFLE
jgi:hypothetical protein